MLFFVSVFFGGRHGNNPYIQIQWIELHVKSRKYTLWLVIVYKKLILIKISEYRRRQKRSAVRVKNDKYRFFKERKRALKRDRARKLDEKRWFLNDVGTEVLA